MTKKLNGFRSEKEESSPAKPWKKQRIEDLGRIYEKVDDLLDMDVFEDHFLSKHNEEEWYPSGHDKWKDKREELIEFLEERLDDSRRQFMGIQEKLWEIHELARGDSE